MSQARPLLPFGKAKADLLPVEILSEIFLFVENTIGSYSRRDLMLVCRRWHAIMLSTPGIQSQLAIRRATQKEAVQALTHDRKWRLGVRVDMNNEKDGSDFNPENFRACFMAATQAAPRWSSLNLISPPPHGEYKALEILQPLMHLKSFTLADGFGEFVGPLMTAISRDAPPNLTTMHLEDPVAVICLGQPANTHITHSLTTLKIQLSKRMDSPVDILPYLHRLKIFEAQRLCLPFYPPDASLPLIRTLRHLLLRSVSIQWMAGRAFPALEVCLIRFPDHADIIQTLQPVTMPSCSHFRYYSNDLQPLSQFHLPSLHKLCATSGQWNFLGGNPQVAALSPVLAAQAESLTDLRLDVECSRWLLLYILRLVPALERLFLGLARPNALSRKFFRAFIVREPDADSASDTAEPPSQTIAPFCPSLKSLYLLYKRWLRGPDQKALIVAFGDIVASRNSKIHHSLNLVLSIGEVRDSVGSGFQELLDGCWSIDTSGRKSPHTGNPELVLGISTRRGIIPISTALPPNGRVPLPFKEAEYLRLQHLSFTSSVEFLLTRDHMELMIYERAPSPTSLPRALPLFDALRVLVVACANPSFLAGFTFPKLERCKVVEQENPSDAYPCLPTETEMPICTRVEIDDPHLLVTFKLPQIHELALNFSHPNCGTIWKNHIAENAKLSGLNLLHMRNWPSDGDLVLVLGSLPLLKTLIISTWEVEFSFRAFLPMDTNRNSGLEQASGEGHTLALLCPRLQYLRIEGLDLSVDPELIPILEDIVTLRAVHGSPLKEFSFFYFWSEPGSKTELIGTDQSFTMEECTLDEGEFELDI